MTAATELLVTGASGFVAPHVIRRARERGIEAVAPDFDLRDGEAVREAVGRLRPRQVIHLARSRRPNAWDQLIDDLRMAGNLLDAMSELEPDAIVLVPGSSAQYGMGSRSPLAETAPTTALTPYGVTKNCLETAVLAPPLTRDIRTIWARTFNVAGPGQDVDAPVAHWASQIARCERAGGGTIRVGNLDVVRDFLDVRDVADAYLELFDVGAQGVVNVCSGEPTRLSELLDLLLDLATVPITVTRDIELERAQDPAHVVGDPSLLGRLTSWRPRISVRDTLDDVLGEWRNRVSDASPPTLGTAARG